MRRSDVKNYVFFHFFLCTLNVPSVTVCSEKCAARKRRQTDLLNAAAAASQDLLRFILDWESVPRLREFTWRKNLTERTGHSSVSQQRSSGSEFSTVNPSHSDLTPDQQR